MPVLCAVNPLLLGKCTARLAPAHHVASCSPFDSKGVHLIADYAAALVECGTHQWLCFCDIVCSHGLTNFA